MPLARPERRKLLVVGGLLVAQLLLVSLQVPLGEAPERASSGSSSSSSPRSRDSWTADTVC